MEYASIEVGIKVILRMSTIKDAETAKRHLSNMLIEIIEVSYGTMIRYCKYRENGEEKTVKVIKVFPVGNLWE